MTHHDNPDLASDIESNAGEHCHSCSEESLAGSRFCEHCGADLHAGSQTARRRSKGKQLGRRRANKEIASIVGILKGVRGLFILLACIYVAVFLLILVGASAMELDGEDKPVIVWSLLMTGSVLLFSLFGAAFLYRNPLAWTLALSCLLSLSVVVGFMNGSIPVLGCFLVLICWSATIKIASIRGLLAEFSDTVAAQRLSGARARVEGGELSTRAKIRSARVRSRSAPKIAAYVVGGILGFGLLIVLATKSRQGQGGTQSPNESVETRASRAQAQLQREESYERIIETFVGSWKKSDHGAISALIPQGDWRTLAMKKFKRSLERYGFALEKLPPIDDRRDLWARNTPVVKTYFRLPDLTGELRAKLRTRWEEVDAKWVLMEVGLRKTKRD